MRKAVAMLIGMLLSICALSSAGALEITDEYIASCGIPRVDETGAPTILVPMDVEFLLTQAHSDLRDRHAEHELQTIWVDQYFTISFSVTAESIVAIAGAEARMSPHAGGEVMLNGTRIYTVTVPEGYVGRLVYRFDCDCTRTDGQQEVPDGSHSGVICDHMAETTPGMVVVYLELKDRAEFFD